MNREQVQQVANLARLVRDLADQVQEVVDNNVIYMHGNDLKDIAWRAEAVANVLLFGAATPIPDDGTGEPDFDAVLEQDVKVGGTE